MIVILSFLAISETASRISLKAQLILSSSTPRKSTHKVALPGTTLIEDGSTSKTPTVATVPLSASLVAASSMAITSLAALTSASLRKPMGVAPE